MKEPELEEKTFIEFEEPKTNKRNILFDIVFDVVFIFFAALVALPLTIFLTIRNIVLFLRNRNK